MREYIKLLVIASLFVLISCSPHSSHPPLRIAIDVVWPTSGVVLIAQERGLFAKYKVPVTLVAAPDYLKTVKLYKEDKVDITFATLIDAIVFNAEGKASRFIYAADYSETGDIIVGRPSLDNLSDLKGKKVSFEGFNSFSHLLVLKLLEQVGLKEGDFQAANIESNDVLEALKTGKIDAGHVYGTNIPDVLAEGYKILGKAGDFPYLITKGFVVNADILKTRSQDVQGVVNALAEATDWLVKFPEEGIKMMAQLADVSATELNFALKELHVFTLQENQVAFKKNGSLTKTSEEIINFFSQKGTLLNSPDVHEILDGLFVSAIGN